MSLQNVDVGQEIAAGSFPAPTQVYRRSEANDAYEGEIARDGRLRLIRCRNDIQWIMQRRKGGKWRPLSFHRQRASLISRYGDLPMFAALPEWHAEREGHYGTQ